MEREEIKEVYHRFNRFNELSWDIAREMTLRDQVEYEYHLNAIHAMIMDKYGNVYQEGED